MIGDDSIGTASTGLHSPLFAALGITGVLLSALCWGVFLSGALRLVTMLRLAQPDNTRTNRPLARLGHLLVEFLAHTRLMRRRVVGLSHWVVMMGFLFGSIVWFEAYIQVFRPDSGWPWLHHQAFYRTIEEFLALGTLLGGLILLGIRLYYSPRRAARHNTQRSSRFYRSNATAGYFVEAVVLIEAAGMLLVKAGQLATFSPDPTHPGSPATDWVTMYIARILPASPLMVSIFALIKLLTGMVWLFVVGRNLRWGVAWHRFAAFANIALKRDADGRPATRYIVPMRSGTPQGDVKTLTLENVDLDEDLLGVGRIDEFTWKDWLDFSVCTECGRCQDLCPAWKSGTPLNPKTLITDLRDTAFTSTDYIKQARKEGMVDATTGRLENDAFPRLLELLPDDDANFSRRDQRKLQKIRQDLELLSRPLVGLSEERARELPLTERRRRGIIDEDVLWACTNCGACVDQCPVDIEHIDHIVQMRRHQVLDRDDYPAELRQLFHHLETKGNPWGQPPAARVTWIDELEKESGFRVPVWGQDVTNFVESGMEYLFWVGCAGAYEDKAKAATKATALLLHLAGVKFCVLGQQETCTGDAARRAGNEFLFQQMASINTELLEQVFAGCAEEDRKILATCAHCFNTLGNEYPQNYQVIHHSVLLNELVNRRRLIPHQPVEGLTTYHDPCFVGRHNGVFVEPRDVVSASGTTVVEMSHHQERALCCGAGGAQIWMDHQQGERMNVLRVQEARSTQATTIATGCPFCTIMLSDGVKAAQGANSNSDSAGDTHHVEVKDLSLLLLESVQRNNHLPQALAPFPVGPLPTEEGPDLLPAENDLAHSEEKAGTAIEGAETAETAAEDLGTPSAEETAQEPTELAEESPSEPLNEEEEESVAPAAEQSYSVRVHAAAIPPTAPSPVAAESPITLPTDPGYLPLLGMVPCGYGIPSAVPPMSPICVYAPPSDAPTPAELAVPTAGPLSPGEHDNQHQVDDIPPEQAPVVAATERSDTQILHDDVELTAAQRAILRVPGLPLRGLLPHAEGVPAARPPLSTPMNSLTHDEQPPTTLGVYIRPGAQPPGVPPSR